MALVPLWFFLGLALLLAVLKFELTSKTVKFVPVALRYIMASKPVRLVCAYIHKPKHTLDRPIPYGAHARVPITLEILLDNLRTEARVMDSERFVQITAMIRKLAKTTRQPAIPAPDEGQSYTY